MIINIDSRDFCNLLNFAVNFGRYYDGSIKFEADSRMDGCIRITLSHFANCNLLHSVKVIFLEDLISGTFGIAEAIRNIIKDMERDHTNYIKEEKK